MSSSTTTQDLVEKLRDLESRLQLELNEARRAFEEKVSCLATQLRRVRRAMASLVGEKRSTHEPAGVRSSSGAGFTTQEIVALTEQILRQREHIVQDELVALIHERAKNLGKKRSGLHLRIRDALKSERFVLGTNGYQLPGRNDAVE